MGEKGVVWFEGQESMNLDDGPGDGALGNLITKRREQTKRL